MKKKIKLLLTSTMTQEGELSRVTQVATGEYTVKKKSHFLQLAYASDEVGPYLMKYDESLHQLTCLWKQQAQAPKKVVFSMDKDTIMEHTIAFGGNPFVVKTSQIEVHRSTIWMETIQIAYDLWQNDLLLGHFHLAYVIKDVSE